LRISIITGFFLPVPPLSGGATERSWYGLAKIFASAGHSVTFVSRRWPGLPPAETEAGVRHIRVPGFDHTRSLAANLLLDFIWGIRAARAMPAGDIVICNTITLPVWLRRFKPLAGKVSVMIGRAPKGQARFYGNVARIYAPSTFIAGKIAPAWAFDRTRVIGYPIDWGLNAACARQRGSPVTIGFIGRLNPEKGIALLLGAARLLAARSDLPEWRLRIAGPSGVSQGGGGDGWIRALQEGARADLGARVEWLGPEFDAARLAGLYGGMDIFCYPSLAEKGETFGVAVAEAMAARCAVVVSALGCFGDLVEDGRTGLVFDHRAPDAERLLCDCLGRLIQDQGLRKDMALRGQQHARRFDYPEVSRNILEDLALLTGAATQKPQE
jgi:glycosyltransferase involved in cell wall biosynthesis